MQIFITGASGNVGSTLIPKLVAAGHTVLALARSDEAASRLEQSPGVKGVKGTVTDLDICGKAAQASDVVIHLAFDHDQAFGGDYVGACEKDRSVIKAMCDGLAQSVSTRKIFFVTSGANGLMGIDETAQPVRNPHAPRYLSTELAFSYADKMQVVEVRLAPITYSSANLHPFIAQPIIQFKRIGTALYPDGTVWPACNVDDAADLYVKAIAAALPNPSTLHAVAEDSVSQEAIAEVIGRRLGFPVKSVSMEEFAKDFGMPGMIASHSKPATAERTREQLGWNPTGRALLACMEDYVL